MKITKKLLSIPPFLVTPWENVVSVQLEKETLLVGLADGSRASIPGLESKAIANIFAIYEQHLEEEPSFDSLSPFENSSETAHPATSALNSFRFGITGPEGFPGLPAVMQHDPALMDGPDLPAELLEKVAGIARVVASEEIPDLPKAEPHCNCPHCQFTRVLKGETREISESLQEEIVSDEELSFREWDIEESGEKMYCVRNPLDAKEEYQVYLGDPVGCTCGESNCEHIKHVLRH